MEDSFPQTEAGEDGLGMIQVRYSCCALYLYYYYISSTSDHQALIRSWKLGTPALDRCVPETKSLLLKVWSKDQPRGHPLEGF